MNERSVELARLKLSQSLQSQVVGVDKNASSSPNDEDLINRMIHLAHPIIDKLSKDNITKAFHHSVYNPI